MIFCGGQGMRLETGTFSERLPKPMASIGGRPLLWHLMKYYAHYGHTEFVLCLGYRGGAIKRLLRACGIREGRLEFDFVDTGIESSIGERFAAHPRLRSATATCSSRPTATRSPTRSYPS